jgi:hypothetical protein
VNVGPVSGNRRVQGCTVTVHFTENVDAEFISALAGICDMIRIYSGLFAWWLLTFGGASVYAFCAFPWKDKVLAWPRKK